MGTQLCVLYPTEKGKKGKYINHPLFKMVFYFLLKIILEALQKIVL